MRNQTVVRSPVPFAAMGFFEELDRLGTGEDRAVAWGGRARLWWLGLVVGALMIAPMVLFLLALDTTSRGMMLVAGLVVLPVVGLGLGAFYAGFFYREHLRLTRRTSRLPAFRPGDGPREGH